MLVFYSLLGIKRLANKCLYGYFVVESNSLFDINFDLLNI